jgi:hypothetical protein
LKTAKENGDILAGNILNMADKLQFPKDNAYKLYKADINTLYANSQDKIGDILTDFNFDGEHLHNDTGGLRTGLEIKDIWDKLNLDEKKQAFDNILAVAKNQNTNLSL